ncbi:asparagine synthase (glutamine-hydrolyzing) [Candidatus Thioglobus sp.]|nr:asparagine synthase (glutamine-hydrolyzing) [Candidatus Thioglobus sp.]
MCGIVGFWTTKTSSNSDVDKMSFAISHRGPDDYGAWSNGNGLHMAHRRLSIIDLSVAGHQPMESQCGRYILTYNGEIYNHESLRKKIDILSPNYQWVGHSDTETLLAAICFYGLEKALKSLNGMFAFAVFDKKINKLFLARDHLGQKPLYYGYNNNIFFFGSELKAIKSHRSFVGEIDRDSLSLQLKYNYIPAPKTIYKGISKLLPGSFLEISLSNIHDVPTPKVYWSFLEVTKDGSNNQLVSNEKSIISSLDNILSNSVKSQLISDVPLGAFLSGGIDSSLVVALMQKYSAQQVKTFTIGFNEKNRNEAIYAKQIANYLGTDHTELYVSAKEALDVIPLLPSLYDEPFSDSSQIPTFLLAQMTQKHVKVALSGDGADELFGGYNRHFKTYQWWSKINKMPMWARGSISKGIDLIPSQAWNALSKAHVKGLRDKMQKFTKVLNASDSLSLYDGLVSHWDESDCIVIKNDKGMQISKPNFNFNTDAELIMALDTLNYLPDDILTKVDRAGMAVSLETRMPFLDQQVVDFSWKIPLSMKIRDGHGKWILRQILYNYVPNKLLERPKMGFGVPLDEWLRGPLREWAEDLLREDRLRQEGYFYPEPIRRKWSEHLSGKKNWQYLLWDVLMFQAWLTNE